MKIETFIRIFIKLCIMYDLLFVLWLSVMHDFFV
jgi:hypothetical protein